MEQFFDSTALLDHPAKLRARLRQDGYLFLRGVVSLAAIQAAYGDIMQQVANGGWLLPNTRPEERMVDAGMACAEPEPQFRSVYDKVFALQSLHSIPHDPALLAVFREALNCLDLLVHPRTIGRLIFPCAKGALDFTTPAHQDYWAIQGSPDALTAWVPLHDCPYSHGSLMVAEGTHRDGIFGYRLALGAGGVEVDDPLDGRWRGGDFKAGDVLLFSTLTVHRAAPNLTNRMRISIDCRVQRPDEPITKPCTDLAGMGYTWEDVYSGWTRPDLMFYWRKYPLREVPYSPKYYARRDELALSEGEKGNPLALASLQRLAQYHADADVRTRAASLISRLETA